MPKRTSITPADTRRSVALGAATAAFVLIPTVGPLLSGGSNSGGATTPITPPGWAFSIWGPIFAVSSGVAVEQLRSPASDVARATGWPLAGAYAGNAAWSIASQSERYTLTGKILPVATTLAALAYRRLQGVAGPGTGTTAAGTGLLLGWTALASVIGASVDLKRRSVDLDAPAAVVGQAIAVAGTAGGLTAVAARSGSGGAALAAAASWGLGALALARRPAAIRVAAALGAAGVLAARLLRR